MLNTKVEKFLEENNLTYLFLMLANLEVERLVNLPDIIRTQFKGKLTEKALEHVALNVIPDYIADLPKKEEINPFA
jgi:hypothetical protein